MKVPVTFVEASPTDDVLAIARETGGVSLWSTVAGGVVEQLIHKELIIGARWSPDGQYLAVAEKSGSLSIYDRTGLLSWIDTGHELLGAITFHTSGALLATGGAVGKVIVWRTSDLSEAYRIPCENAPPVRSLAFNGDMLIAGFEDGSLEAFTDEGKTREGGGQFFHTGALSAMARHPTEPQITLGGERGGLIAMDAGVDWKRIAVWSREPPPPIAVNQITYSADGTEVLAACSDDVARVISNYGHFPSTLGTPFWERRPKRDWDPSRIVTSACYDRRRPLIYTGRFDGMVHVFDRGPGHRLLLKVDIDDPSAASAWKTALDKVPSV